MVVGGRRRGEGGWAKGAGGGTAGVAGVKRECRGGRGWIGKEILGCELGVGGACLLIHDPRSSPLTTKGAVGITYLPALRRRREQVRRRGAARLGLAETGRDEREHDCAGGGGGGSGGLGRTARGGGAGREANHIQQLDFRPRRISDRALAKSARCTRRSNYGENSCRITGSIVVGLWMLWNLGLDKAASQIVGIAVDELLGLVSRYRRRLAP